MPFQVLLRLALAALTLLFVFPAPAGTPAPPRDVAEAFTQLPSQLVFGLTTAERSRLLQSLQAPGKNYGELDRTNGYLRTFRGLEPTGPWLEMALFPSPGGNSVIGLSSNPGPPPLNSLTARFYAWEQGAWKDVTAQVLPPMKSSHGFHLPKLGIVLEVRKREYDVTASLVGPVLFRLHWNGRRFVRTSRSL